LAFSLAVPTRTSALPCETRRACSRISARSGRPDPFPAGSRIYAPDTHIILVKSRISDKPLRVVTHWISRPEVLRIKPVLQENCPRINIQDKMATNLEWPMTRYFTELWRAWLWLIWAFLGPIVLFAAFIFGMLSTSSWIYHPTLFISLMLPALFMARCAITGRSAASGWSARVTTNFGSGLLLLFAAVFFLGYCYAVYDKIRG
jgi:hypothetical protein